MRQRRWGARTHRAHRAAAHGNIGLIDTHIERGFSVDTADRHGNTALHWAAREGHAEAVGHLLGLGASAAARTGSGWNAATMAAYHGHERVLELLVARGHTAEFDAGDAIGWTAVSWAAAAGRVEIMALLASAGAALEPVGAGYTPLMIAARAGHLPLVKYLLRRGVDWDRRSALGEPIEEVACAALANSELCHMFKQMRAVKDREEGRGMNEARLVRGGTKIGRNVDL